jgi:hypothetical protein
MLQRYVTSVLYGCCKSRLRCCICCKCFKGSCKRLFKVFHLLSDVCCKCLDLDAAYVSHICYNITFQMFQLFHYYVALSIFMLRVFYFDVAYVSYKVCKYMFQMFHMHLSVSCCKCFMFQRYIHFFKESWGHGPNIGRRGAASYGLANGAQRHT